MRPRLLMTALLAGALCAGSAIADSRITFGLHFGIPLYWPAPYYSYYPPYYYPPPPLYYPPYSPPVIYTQPPYAEGRAPAPAEQSYSWYYCAESRGYYPYVRECPGGWQRVSAVPPPAP
jgi:hypothetical protein